MKALVFVVAVSLTLLPVTVAGAVYARYVVVSSCRMCGFPTVRTDHFGRGHRTDECLRCGYVQDARDPAFGNGIR